MGRENMYTGDLAKLLGMLKETRANDVIYTKWTGRGEPWQAQLTLLGGRVTFCHVWSSTDGHSLLTNGQAIRWLANRGNLIWERAASTQQQPSHSLLRTSQADLLSPFEVPQRLMQVGQEEMRSWVHKQRQVFALVDGQRSIERIAAILCQPFMVVEGIALELQSKGVIAVGIRADEPRGEEGTA